MNATRVKKPIMQEKLLKQDEFRTKFGRQAGFCHRKGLLLWKDTKAIHVQLPRLRHRQRSVEAAQWILADWPITPSSW